MRTFIGLAIGLSIVFGCLLLALVAGLNHLLWWKKRITNREVEEEEEEHDDYTTNSSKDLFHLICCKKPFKFQIKNSTQHGEKDPTDGVHVQEHDDLELGTGKDLEMKAFGEEGTVESELMKLHNLSGPPRFLFTIKEETKEDLESEDGRIILSRKGSRTRSLSDDNLMLSLDTQFLSPLPSPKLKSPSWKNPNLESYYHCHGFNPLFESSMEAELNRPRSSPPPTFKFLRNAEEKLLRRLMEESEKMASKNSLKASNSTEETEGSFLGFLNGKKKEGEIHHHHDHQLHSISSQVLPLASSPTTFRPQENHSSSSH